MPAPASTLLRSSPSLKAPDSPDWVLTLEAGGFHQTSLFLGSAPAGYGLGVATKRAPGSPARCGEALDAGSLQCGFLLLLQKLAGGLVRNQTPCGHNSRAWCPLGLSHWTPGPAPCPSALVSSINRPGLTGQPSPQHFICYFCLIHHKYTGTYVHGIL